jgi:hypothetical protein
MTTPNVPVVTSSAASTPDSAGARLVLAAPSRRWLLAALAGLLVLVAGIAGGIVHTGLFFVPALVALAVGSAGLWRERP